MSLFDEASLVITPNGYKEGKLYSIKPTDGSGDLDVVRATTATRVNSDGLIESVDANVPRLDYINGSCPSILVEPQRTNLALYSNDFSTWSGSGYITANYDISPDGTQNASRCLFTGANQILSTSSTLSTGVACSATIYIKGTSGETIQLAAGGVDKKHTLNGSWQRIETNATSINSTILLNTFGGATARDILIYGAQLEQGSYATSYIPTVASAVTRNADVISKTGISGLIGQTEGTLFFDGSVLSNDGTSRQISLSDGSSSTNKLALIYTSTSNQLQAFIRSSGSISFNVSVILTSAINENKIALKYKQNDFALWVNGVQLANSTSGNVPSLLNKLSFDDADGTNTFKGNVKQVQLYKEALTDEQLAQLTTI